LRITKEAGNHILFVKLMEDNSLKGCDLMFRPKETREEKEQKELQKFMERYQLEDLDEKDLVVLRRITQDLAGNKWMKAGMALSFAKVEEQAKMTYLSALVEQNWMIVRQLSRLNVNIERLLSK